MTQKSNSTKNSKPQIINEKKPIILDNRLPIVAIVGKPNVGKSTLLNIVCGKKVAITDDKPGVTRDRKYYPAHLFGWDFIAVDTAGWDIIASHASESIHQKMLRQTMAAIDEADAVVLVVDGKNGLSSLDRDFVDVVRRRAKNIVLTVNKTESKIAVTSDELFALGLGEPIYIAATHNVGLGELHERLIELLPTALNKKLSGRSRAEAEAIKKNTTTITICGRPNVGKSTMFNAILGEERSIVDSEAGTTRDAIAAILDRNLLDRKLFPLERETETELEKKIYNQEITEEIDKKKNEILDTHEENKSSKKFDTASNNKNTNTNTTVLTPMVVADISEIELVDTAGVRKRGKVAKAGSFEFRSVGQSIASVRRADVVVLVMDANSPLDRQDLSIARMTVNEGKGLVLVFNKIDTLKQKEIEGLKKDALRIVNQTINEIVHPPMIYTSAINGDNVKEVINIAQMIKSLWQKSFNTSLLNRWLERVVKEHLPARGKNNRQVKIKYISQIATQPPTFQIFSNVETIDQTYISYLRQKMAERFNLFGVPLRFICKKSDNPYERANGQDKKKDNIIRNIGKDGKNRKKSSESRVNIERKDAFISRNKKSEDDKKTPKAKNTSLVKNKKNTKR